MNPTIKTLPLRYDFVLPRKKRGKSQNNKKLSKKEKKSIDNILSG
jgi:hypothetical protein